AERLGHGDLNTGDVSMVPDRLEERVGKPEIEQVLHGLLAEVVVDAEDGFLGEGFVQRRVQGPGRVQIAPERLLDDQTRATGPARLRQVRRDRTEETRGNRQVEHRTNGRTQRLT